MEHILFQLGFFHKTSLKCILLVFGTFRLPGQVCIFVPPILFVATNMASSRRGLQGNSDYHAEEQALQGRIMALQKLENEDQDMFR
jgi:hypothetical protein